MSGPSEILSVLLMAAHFDVKVCPHAGGVGLCEYVRHLSMIDYCCFSGSLEGRVCESTTHLHEFFEDPVDFQTVDDKYRYIAPVAPGYAKFRPESLREWSFPFGSCWADEAAVGTKLKNKAESYIADEVQRAQAVIAAATARVGGAAGAGFAYAGGVTVPGRVKYH